MAAKKVVKKKSSSSLSNSSIDRLIDSNIAMQHKMTDVLLGVKELNENVSTLVKIFKSAGEHIKAEKYEDPMINKINILLEENQKISQAIVLLEKIVKEKALEPRPNPLSESHY